MSPRLLSYMTFYFGMFGIFNAIQISRENFKNKSRVNNHKYLTRGLLHFYFGSN